jgi:glycosyltransferase involved in cell wall biosynthesis
MKILHINSYYGKSSFYKNLYDIQVQEGLDIDVFVSVSSKYRKTDFDYGEYTLVSKNHRDIDRFLFHFKQNKILRDLCNKYNVNDYTLIHAHSLFTNGYSAWRLKKKFKTPYIVAVRNTDVNIFFKKMVYLRKLGVEILKHADHIIFLSEAYRDEVIKQYVPDKLKEIFLSKTSVIPNGVDSFWLENKGIAKSIAIQNELKVLYVGVINENKNILTTIKSIELLRESGFQVTFTIVGRVEDQAIFNVLAHHDFIEYIEPKTKEELLNLYRQNDIFVLPSVNESFGIVYLEAISQGLPVIYSKGQGFDGHFSDGEVGYRVDCFDHQEIADRIKSIADDYENISVNCIRNVVKFDWGSINQEYLDLYVAIGEDEL